MSFHSNIMNNQNKMSFNNEAQNMNNQMLFARYGNNPSPAEQPQMADLRAYHGEFKSVNFNANFDTFSQKIPPGIQGIGVFKAALINNEKVDILKSGFENIMQSISNEINKEKNQFFAGMYEPPSQDSMRAETKISQNSNNIIQHNLNQGNMNSIQQMSNNINSNPADLYGNVQHE